MPYFHKRTEKSEDCKLDEPVPLSYYSSLSPGTIPRFHPRTMRDLMILKSKEFIDDKKVKADDEDLVSFINDFKTELFKMSEIGKTSHEEKNNDWNIFMGKNEGDYFMGLNDDKTNFREIEANLTEDDRKACWHGRPLRSPRAEDGKRLTYTPYSVCAKSIFQ